MKPSEALRPASAIERRELAVRTRVRGLPRYGFTVADLNLVPVPRDVLCEVLPRPAVQAFPLMPEWMEGICNLRGTVVPVLDLGAVLGDVSEDDSNGEHLLFLDRGERTVAVPMNGVTVRIPDDDERVSLPPLPAVLEEHAVGACLHEGQVWVYVDVRALFSTLGGRQREDGTRTGSGH